MTSPVTKTSQTPACPVSDTALLLAVFDSCLDLVKATAWNCSPARSVSFPKKIKQQAADRGMSVSQYVADLLAIQAGHPELVRELDKEVLPLAM